MALQFSKRRTLQSIARADFDHENSPPQSISAVLAISMVAVQKKSGDKMAFRLVVTTNYPDSMDPNPPGAMKFDVCDEAGKVRVFGTADNAIKALVKAGLIGYVGDVPVTLEGEDFAAPAPYTGDPVNRAQNQYVGEAALLAKSNTALTKAVGDLTIMLATGGYAQSVIDEKELQVIAINDTIALHTDVMTSLAALITAAGGVVPTV